MLRLLAQRGEQGYDDLASLTGQSVGEVRAKVIGALAQLEAEGEPVPDVPMPAPSEPEAAVPVPAPEKPDEPAPPEPEKPAQAPAAEPLPPKEPPPTPPPTKPTSPSAGAPKAGGPKLALPKDRGVQAAIAASLLAIVAIVVILIVGGSGGSGGSEPAASGTGETANAAESSELTQATLTPVEGGSGEGRAIFGRVKKNVVLQVEAKGLEPSPQGSAYTIWLYKSPKLALRVGAVKVDQNGTIAVQLPIPTELLAYVASGAFNQIDIALTETSAYAAEVAKSKQEKRLPEHVGTSVLRGEITGPAVKASGSGG